MARLDDLLAMLPPVRREAPCVRRVFARAAECDANGGGWRLVRAPGRVNLIGEHTDYNGLPVMPMAINREITALFRPLPRGQVSLLSADGFEARSFEASRGIDPYRKGDWGNYAKAAVQKLTSEFGLDSPSGLEAVIGGDIPGGAGLSSSSALVVAMALAFAAVNNLEIEPSRLADLMADGEQYVGTRGGGMDQAACLLGEQDRALRMDFRPLRIQPVPLPEGAEVIIANSLVVAEKSAEAKARYNLRSAECAMACALLGTHYGSEYPLLAHFHAAFEDPAAALEGVIEPRPMKPEEIAGRLAMTMGEFDQHFLDLGKGESLKVPGTGFQPYARARHVLTETRRVEKAQQALTAGDIAEVGALMNASHASCRDDHEVSCSELEALTRAARESGAAGARLTGAGFGGCIVALARSEDVSSVLDGIRRRYYEDWAARERPELLEQMQGSVSDNLFTSRPQTGARVLG